MNRLQGKTALVTGGGGGIGGATCRRLAGEGSTVLVADRDAEGAEATAQAIRDAGGQATAAECDIADRGKVDAAVAAAGQVDILVNNAGWDVFKPFTKTVAVGTLARRASEGSRYSSSPLPRMWAKQQIELLTSLGAEQHKERIIALSKAMSVMSPVTSLLVLENEEMYEQYKIDRGRKDHWAIYPAPELIEVVQERGARSEEREKRKEAEPLDDEDASNSRLADDGTSSKKPTTATRWWTSSRSRRLNSPEAMRVFEI